MLERGGWKEGDCGKNKEEELAQRDAGGWTLASLILGVNLCPVIGSVRGDRGCKGGRQGKGEEHRKKRAKRGKRERESRDPRPEIGQKQQNSNE